MITILRVYLLKKNDTCNDLIFKIVQHADVCTNMLKDTNSLRKATETITEFSKVAGPKLNLEKNRVSVNWFIYRYVLQRFSYTWSKNNKDLHKIARYSHGT